MRSNTVEDRRVSATGTVGCVLCVPSRSQGARRRPKLIVVAQMTQIASKELSPSGLIRVQ